ncbi:hypothetical protein ADILRU_1820 [Leifsonia rubra CMS 76R]|nr:hypothetical protein ADILRU_1820 [Leifsonia rubra CMS 76R]
MSDMHKRYELTVSLSFADSPAVQIDQVVLQLEESLTAILKDYPAVTAYFVSGEEAEVEIVVGLRFEGMPAKNIRSTADEIIQLSLSAISNSSGSSFEATREESTLIPA